MNQHQQEEFRVSFGRIGRVLVYEDAAGKISFAFDCSPAEKESGKQWNLHLSRLALIDAGEKLTPSEARTAIEKQRVKSALERVAEYASACGYAVVFE